MSEFEKGFIAGMLEGEGSLQLARHKRKGRKNIQIEPKIYTSTTSLPLMKYCHKIIGKGWIVKHYYRRSDGSRGCCYEICIKRMEDILELLTLIKPHLIAKKKEAELMTEFIKSRLSRKMVHRFKIYTPREFKISEKLQKFHKKGRRVRFGYTQSAMGELRRTPHREVLER